MQVTADTDRCQLTVRVEHVDAQMRDGLTNRHAAAGVQCVFAGGVVDHAADHGFGRAVFVDQPRVWCEGLPACECCCGQGFAADHHHCRAERSWMIGQLLTEHFQMGRGEFDQAQRAGIAQALAQGVERVVLGQQFDPCTAQQWGEQAGQRCIEGQRGRHHCTRERTIGGDGPLQVMRSAGVSEQRALGLAGGT